jgi:hypothetical protein
MSIDTITSVDRTRPVLRWLLPVGWALAAIGYFGPWIAHETAALTVTGVDLAELVKFVPGVADGSVPVSREVFFLPPVAVVISVAILIGSRELGYPWPFQALVLGLAIPLSLQLLPPAWAPTTLLTAEFRLQTAALGLCWLLLGSFWLLGRLSLALRSGLSTALGLAATALPLWQFITVKPAVDSVYGTPVTPGWGLFACLAGLALMATTGAALFLDNRQRGTGPWSG